MTVHVDRSVRLPETEYFAEPQRKTGIALHHTVGRSARSTVEHWRNDHTAGGAPRRVGTAYVVERDGTVFEVFDPETWAYQFGLTWPVADRIAFEKRFIGIEIASEGGLIERDGILYAFGTVSPRTMVARAEALDYGREYRGYRWFDRYEPEQLDAVGNLVDELCGGFEIPRQYPEHPFEYHGEALAAFEGVIGHAMVRPDKSDPAPDRQLWDVLGDLAALRPTTVQPSAPPRASALLNQSEIDVLFMENARHINAMSTAAGSMVKALVMELERRRVYLRLGQPARKGHTIGYTVAQGDARLVPRLARALGFASVTSGTLEVRHA